MPNQLSQHERIEPLHHKPSHEKGGSDEVNLTGLSGKSLYVDRVDPASDDFTLGDLTTDGAWHELDLGGIVPVGAHAVNMIVSVSDNLANQAFTLRKNGNINSKNRLKVNTQVSNIPQYAVGMVACDNNRKIEYTAANTTWGVIRIVVGGWLI